MSPVEPMSLMDAVEGTRRELLVTSRRSIARVIDEGVPAHALGRLLSELKDLDAEIRKLDATEAEEAHDAEPTSDEVWDPAAI